MSPSHPQMGPDPTPLVLRSKVHHVEIRDLPAEVLLLVFSLLHGQDIARCMRVCLFLYNLIRSEVCLQYSMELAQNGMTDGPSSTLLVSERLQRLRTYSANFRNGIFDHDTLDDHPDYVRRSHDIRWNYATSLDASSSVLYRNTERDQSVLSVFTHGSAQAGIQSRRLLMPVGTTGDRTRWTRNWAIDRAQDLLITVEKAELDLNVGMDSCEFHFWSLGCSETARTDHPGATVSCVQVFPPPGSTPAAHIEILGLTIAKHHVIWTLWTMDREARYYLVQVFNWRTGQFVSRIDFGTQSIDVIPWGDSRLLVIPTDFTSPRQLHVYSLSPSAQNGPLHTLELPEPELNPGEQVVWHQLTTSLHPPAPEGHFCADPSRSVVLITHHVRLGGIHTPEYASYLIIPYATLFAHIDAAPVVESTDSASNSHSPPGLVPWKDWGPQGCLRLRLPLVREGTRHISLIPAGSRMPIVALSGGSDSSPSLYVFDVDPLAVRHARTMKSRCNSDGSKSTALVEDVEAALPGIVDPGCAAIPYVVYRFALPPSVHRLFAVRMTLTGFGITSRGSGITDSEESWTV